MNYRKLKYVMKHFFYWYRKEMYAIEALDQIKAICKTYFNENCEGCPFSEATDCPLEDNYDSRTVVKILKKHKKVNMLV